MSSFLKKNSSFSQAGIIALLADSKNGDISDVYSKPYRIDEENLLLFHFNIDDLDFEGFK